MPTNRELFGRYLWLVFIVLFWYGGTFFIKEHATWAHILWALYMSVFGALQVIYIAEGHYSRAKGLDYLDRWQRDSVNDLKDAGMDPRDATEYKDMP